MESSQNQKIRTAESCDETFKSQADLQADIDTLKQRITDMEKMIQHAPIAQQNTTGDNLPCSSKDDDSPSIEIAHVNPTFKGEIDVGRVAANPQVSNLSGRKIIDCSLYGQGKISNGADCELDRRARQARN